MKFEKNAKRKLPGNTEPVIIVGKTGRKYTITSEELDSVHIRIAFSNDFEAYVADTLNKVLSEEDILFHAEVLYGAVNFHSIPWLEPLRKFLFNEHVKACQWAYNKVVTRMKKDITLY